MLTSAKVNILDIILELHVVKYFKKAIFYKSQLKYYIDLHIM